MRISKPSQTIVLLSILLAALALLVFTGTLTLNVAPFWLALGAYAVLLFGNLVRRM